MQSKRSMIRIVRTSEGVHIDLSGKLPGRGAYMHELHSCWKVGISSSLSRALKTELTPEDVQRLTAFMATLPDDMPPTD